MTPDVPPKILLELRNAATVQAIVGTDANGIRRIRIDEPQGAVGDEKGDARGPGSYVAFIVIVQLDAPRISPRVPVQRAVLAIRCYGRTRQEAAALRWAVSDVLNIAGGREHTNGLHIYQSIETSGGEDQKDPDTKQPYETVVLAAHASTMAA